jgi:hypothetical protein
MTGATVPSAESQGRMFRSAGKTRSLLLAILCVACFLGSSSRPARADEGPPPVVVAAKTGDAATLKRLLDGSAILANRDRRETPHSSNDAASSGRADVCF